MVVIQPGSFLKGKMALYWTGRSHATRDYVDIYRDYDMIAHAAALARDAAYASDFTKLCEAVNVSYQAQLAEGMDRLPDLDQRGVKYCGGGYGGYAAYLFEDRPQRADLVTIEPHCRV